MEKYPYLDDESTVDDQLNFNLYTPALLDIIESGITPITIGIFGKWGSGKTSLMKMLNYGISGKPTYRSIWFTAWKYDQQESLWRALILRVIDGLFPVDGDGNRLVVDQIDEEDDSLINGIKLLESLEKSIYQDVNWETQGNWSININKTAKGVATLPAWLLLHSFGFGDLSKELGISPEFSKMIERESKKHRINQLKSREQFEDTFKQAISCILGNEGKLIIFIDDLDRCLPEKAIEILEAIKLFLNVEGTIFVLGMDREIIQQGIDIYYRKMINKDETGYLPFMDGDAYLQKIIQIPFTIPKMSAEICGHYIKQMLSQFPSEFTNDETYEITNNIFIQGLISNPRQIKRVINVFHLLRNIVFMYENNHLIPKGNIFWPLLAKTVIIQIQWPELYQEWCRYPLLIQVLEEKYRNLGNEIAFEEISMLRFDEIISPYISDWKKYSLLEKILCIPLNTDSNYHKATFRNMSSKEIESYLYLASASEFQQMPIGNIHAIDWKEELRSGDEVKIRNVISNFQQNVPEQNSEIHKQIKNTMLTLMTSKELSLEKKCIIGEQLGNIGDNRFNKNMCNFPDDEKFGFIGITKDNLYMNGEQGRGQNPPLTDYFMARFPVTVEQFKVYLQANGFSEKEFPLLHQDTGNRPMRYVNIANVISYIDWFNSYVQSMSDSMEINQLFRRGWRADLPSEMEWKISAYGLEEKRFPWGNNKRYDCANTYESNLNRPTPVGLFPEGKSIFLVEDLCGNVWEWTKTEGKRGGRIICGGSFRHELIEMGFSQEESPQNKRADVGFRLVLRQED